MDQQDLEIDHEQFIGEEIPDPWSDPSQTDWPDSKEVTPDELGFDEGPDLVAK